MIIAVYGPTTKTASQLYAAIKALATPPQLGSDTNPSNCAMTDGFTRYCSADGGQDQEIEPTTFYFDPSTNVVQLDFTNDPKWKHVGNGINTNVLVTSKLCTIVNFPNGTTTAVMAQVSKLL